MATIELLTIANHAEVQNGLLYLIGAEWDTVTRTYQAGSDPQPQHLAIAITVVVPWIEANQRHRVELWIEDEDAQVRLMEASFDIELGRPPGKTHGSDSRSPLAMSGIVQFPGSGGYRVRARIGDYHKTYAFRVNDQIVQATQAS
ncbi:MAG: hypothetical protein F4017_06885 [Acidimicrobiaceae bacterium]|nr:hypothetical protein [Acidimicrobiaceae bacterium]MYK74301.1 hypothetical protein [Acidimicrobiaceae bacterium]